LLRDRRNFIFQDIRPNKLLTMEIVVVGNDESTIFKKCYPDTFHLIDWSRVNEILYLLLQFYKEKKFNHFAYLSVADTSRKKKKAVKDGKKNNARI
jgi:hypothetical protein